MRFLTLLPVAALLSITFGAAVLGLNTRGGCVDALDARFGCVPAEVDAISTFESRQSGPCTPGTYTCDWPAGVDVMVCNVSGNWQLAAECGYHQHCITNNNVPYCVNNAGVARPALAETTTRDGCQGELDARGGCQNEVSATNELEVTRRDDKCEAGTYGCQGIQTFIVCNVQGNWETAGLCGSFQRCEIINSVPYCLVDPSTERALPDTAELETREALQLQTNNASSAAELEAEGYCPTPASYSCDGSAAIKVCTTQHKWEVAAYCASYQHCQAGVGGVPYCLDGEGKADDLPASAALETRALPASAELVARQSRCYQPGTYSCYWNGNEAVLTVCGIQGCYLIAGYCGPQQGCGDFNGVPYCVRVP